MAGASQLQLQRPAVGMQSLQGRSEPKGTKGLDSVEQGGLRQGTWGELTPPAPSWMLASFLEDFHGVQVGPLELVFGFSTSWVEVLEPWRQPLLEGLPQATQRLPNGPLLRRASSSGWSPKACMSLSSPRFQALTLIFSTRTQNRTASFAGVNGRHQPLAPDRGRTPFG